MKSFPLEKGDLIFFFFVAGFIVGPGLVFTPAWEVQCGQGKVRALLSSEQNEWHKAENHLLRERQNLAKMLRC